MLVSIWPMAVSKDSPWLRVERPRVLMAVTQMVSFFIAVLLRVGDLQKRSVGTSCIAIFSPYLFLCCYSISYMKNMILFVGWSEPARTVPVRLATQAAFLPILDA